MFMLCRVCAQFRDARGKVIFTVDRGLVNQFTEAPDAIQEDPLFAMLKADGSLQSGLTDAQKKVLENDPMAGAEPDGKEKAEPDGKQKAAKPKPVKPRAEAKGNEEAEKKDGSEAAPTEK